MNNKFSVLMVEDNLGDAHLVRLYLKECGLKANLIHVESMAEARPVIEKEAIDLVLLDLSLPDSYGFRTLTNFQERYPELPVVVMTGINDDIVGNQAIKSGAQDYLVKGEFEAKTMGRVMRYALQRHKTQQKLEETAKSLIISDKRFLEAQQMVKFGSWDVNLVTNEMKWSDETFRIFGFLPRQFAPTLSDYIRYVYVEDRSNVEAFFAAATKSGELQKIEHRVVTPDHNIKYVQAYAKVYYDDITDKFIVLGGIQDITERKHSEQLFAERSIANNGIKVKKEMLESLGFQIKTPLSSLLNFAYLLDKSRLDEQQREYVNALKTSADDITLTINNLLNFSLLTSEKIKLEEEEFEPKTLLQCIEKSLKLKAVEKQIILALSADDSLADPLIGDVNKINHILYTFMGNAVKYSPERSEVILKIGLKHTSSKNALLTLDIKDSGPGIDPKQLADCMKPDYLESLYADNEPIEKKSLGIAISHKLIATMGGNIRINSTGKLGTHVHIELPLEVAYKQARMGSDTPESPLKILLVEDHFLNQLATKKILTTWSDFVTVDIAENGLVGVEKFREYKYDLVLMDIQMPIMDGMEATRKIRERSQVPIIALTANSSKQEADNCMQQGFNGYITKPFKPSELYEKIMEVMSLAHAAVDGMA